MACGVAAPGLEAPLRHDGRGLVRAHLVAWFKPNQLLVNFLLPFNANMQQEKLRHGREPSPEDLRDSAAAALRALCWNTALYSARAAAAALLIETQNAAAQTVAYQYDVSMRMEVYYQRTLAAKFGLPSFLLRLIGAGIGHPADEDLAYDETQSQALVVLQRAVLPKTVHLVFNAAAAPWSEEVRRSAEPKRAGVVLRLILSDVAVTALQVAVQAAAAGACDKLGGTPLVSQTAAQAAAGAFATFGAPKVRQAMYGLVARLRRPQGSLRRRHTGPTVLDDAV